MENGNRTLDLVIDWKKHDYPLKGKLNKLSKERVKEALAFGKMVAVSHCNYKTKKLTREQLAFYANNTLVYVSKDGCPRNKDRSRNGWTYEIMGVHFLKNKEVPNEISLETHVEFQDPKHVNQQLGARVVSNMEVYHTLKEGLFVPDHKVSNGYVYYDRYYFCNDVCVLARKTKSKIVVATAYRITPVADNDFLRKLPEFEHGLKSEGWINFSIKNATAEKEWHRTDEYWDSVMVAHIRKHSKEYSSPSQQITHAMTLAKGLPVNFQRRLKFLKLHEVYHGSEQGKRWLESTAEAASIMKLVELGGIPYCWKPEDNGLTFKDFSNNVRYHKPNTEWTFLIDIETKEDKLTKRQKRYLQLLGFDLDRYSHDREHNGEYLRLGFPMQNYSVNSNPWAHNNWEQEKVAT